MFLAFDKILSEKGSGIEEAPDNVKAHLRSGEPHSVHDSAWLVMYYTAMLNTPAGLQVKEMLMDNLWLALSDARLLLEPRETNMQAILLVLSEAVEITSPTLCWMLASSACRMFQALGTNHRTLTAPARNRRRITFWHLNLLDKGLAIIFGRSPTFNSKMARDLEQPTVKELRTAMGDFGTSHDGLGIFAAHYLYQKILLSQLMHNIWSTLFDTEIQDEPQLSRLKHDLDTWYEGAQNVSAWKNHSGSGCRMLTA